MSRFLRLHFLAITSSRNFVRASSRVTSVVARADFKAAVAGPKAMFVRLSATERRLCCFGLAQRESDRRLFVEIGAEVGFAAKHSDYIFSSSGTIAEGSRSPPRTGEY